MKMRVLTLVVLVFCTSAFVKAMQDSYNLDLFTKAQDSVYAQVVQELQSGKKKTHWIWFIFPQIDGLGSTQNSQLYAIKSLEEAEDYLRHPILGKRLEECTRILLRSQKGHLVDQIFGRIDTVKLKSSMTLFAQASSDPNSVFFRALKTFFGSKGDKKTLDILESMKNGTYKPSCDQANGQNSGFAGTNKSKAGVAGSNGPASSFLTRRTAGMFVGGLLMLLLWYKYWNVAHDSIPSDNSLEKDL